MERSTGGTSDGVNDVDTAGSAGPDTAREAGAADRRDWIEHRRGDGELVGWMRPEGDGFVVIDLLGRPMSDVVDWLAAEELLEERGLGYLAEPFMLDGARTDDGPEAGARPLRVRITEVDTTRIRVKKDDFGAIDAPLLEYTLDWPAPPELRPIRPDERHVWP